MRRVELAQAERPWPMCGSAVEKVLLKRGLLVEDWCDGPDQAQMSRAADPGSGFVLEYVKPAYCYPGRDRAADLAGMLARVGDWLGMEAAGAEALVRRELAAPPEGFSCLRCGRCCSNFGDSFRGRVAVEEVDWWRGLGLDWLLRFVREERRPGYSFFRAWVNPRNGEYLPRCPWLKPARGPEPALCRIHAARPLKCRAFPLTLDHAERAACPGAGIGASPRPAAPRAA
jgi:Fe-S-cluster containining protein